MHTIVFSLFVGTLITITFQLMLFTVNNRYSINQKITTILDRVGVVVATSPTHYKIKFDDGSIFWCRPSHFKEKDS
jgi:hypothetical protein